MTVRVKTRNRKALGKIAKQTLEAEIGVQKWHLDHIRHGLSEANAGKFAPTRTVNVVITRLRKK